MSNNNYNFDRLKELPYPAALRIDGLAETLVDDDGNIYLLPLAEHDFVATSELQRAGLTDAEVIEDSGGQIIRYPVESDIISLASVLNSFEGSQHRKNAELRPILAMVGEALDAMSEKLGKLPQELSVADLAINRTLGQAELIAPYMFENDDTKRGYDLFMGLCNDILQRSSTEEFRQRLGANIDRIIQERGWRNDS